MKFLAGKREAAAAAGGAGATGRGERGRMWPTTTPTCSDLQYYYYCVSSVRRVLHLLCCCASVNGDTPRSLPQLALSTALRRGVTPRLTASVHILRQSPASSRRRPQLIRPLRGSRHCAIQRAHFSLVLRRVGMIRSPNPSVADDDDRAETARRGKLVFARLRPLCTPLVDAAAPVAAIRAGLASLLAALPQARTVDESIDVIQFLHTRYFCCVRVCFARRLRRTSHADLRLKSSFAHPNQSIDLFSPSQLVPRGLAACSQYALFPLTHQLQYAPAGDEQTRMLALACVDALVQTAGVATREAVRAVALWMRVRKNRVSYSCIIACFCFFGGWIFRLGERLFRVTFHPGDGRRAKRCAEAFHPFTFLRL